MTTSYYTVEIEKIKFPELGKNLNLLMVKCKTKIKN